MSDRRLLQPEPKKTSYAYAWSGEGDLYDQAFALNRGRFNRAREQMRTHPYTPLTQRKQSSMTVIASSHQVKRQLLQKHREKRLEIAQDKITSQNDVAEAQRQLNTEVWAETGRKWGTYNPIRLLSWWSSNTTSTDQTSDTTAISDKRYRLRVFQGVLADHPKEEAIHAGMRFIEMKDLPSGKKENKSRKLHLLGHGGPGFPAFTTTQNPGRDASQYKLFDDLASDFHQQGVLDKFSDLRMESCWSANPVRTDQYMGSGYTHKHTDLSTGETTLAPAAYLHRELKKANSGRPFQIKAYEGKGSQLSNPIGQKQRNLTNPMVTVRQSTVAHVFSSLQDYT